MLIQANAVRIPLADGSVHTCVTSPPYWGLRKYAGDQGVEWPEVRYAPMAGLPEVCVPAMRCDLGLEPTPEAYVGHLVLVFREIRRVLREDGVAWINLGYSYWGGKGQSGHANPEYQAERVARGESFSSVAGHVGGHGLTRPSDGKHPGIKPKDLVMIPARVALALQADGWWLRSDCIWAKGNPMPESVTDRPTKAHEYIFLLAKAERYWYDADAVRESAKAVWSIDASWRIQRVSASGGALDGGIGDGTGEHASRNLRTVWNVNTQPSSVAHFATWPPALVERMLKAALSERGCCPKCGAQWRRVVEKPAIPHDGQTDSAYQAGSTANRLALLRQAARERGEEYSAQVRTIGWQPSCNCGLETTAKPIVLDPFAGSGTTGVVAANLGARFVGLDMAHTYLHDIASPRLSTEFGAGVTTAPEPAPLSALPLFAGGAHDL